MRLLKIDTKRLGWSRLYVHPAAANVHKAWLNSGPPWDRIQSHRLLTPESAGEALLCSPLPVLAIEQAGSKRLDFGVVGRFSTYDQINRVRPRSITLLILNKQRAEPWTAARIGAVAQALHVIEIGGRCAPIAEIAAVRESANDEGWTALANERPSLNHVARQLDITRERFRRRASDPGAAPSAKAALAAVIERRGKER